MPDTDATEGSDEQETRGVKRDSTAMQDVANAAAKFRAQQSGDLTGMLCSQPFSELAPFSKRHKVSQLCAIASGLAPADTLVLLAELSKKGKHHSNHLSTEHMAMTQQAKHSVCSQTLMWLVLWKTLTWRCRRCLASWGVACVCMIWLLLLGWGCHLIIAPL